MEDDMNQTSWLEQTLDKEKQRLVSARQALKKNPASYSARVTLQSAENRSFQEVLTLKTGCPGL